MQNNPSTAQFEETTFKIIPERQKHLTCNISLNPGLERSQKCKGTVSATATRRKIRSDTHSKVKHNQKMYFRVYGFEMLRENYGINLVTILLVMLAKMLFAWMQMFVN